MAENTNFLTPVGRIVQGHPMHAQDKNMNGQPLTDKNGNSRVNYFMGVAFSKSDPAVAEEFGKLWGLFQQAAQSGFPGGQYNAPGFSWKLIDGDSLDAQGQPYSNREGFAGHYIIRFNSGFAPKCYTAGGARQIVDPEELKRGYYVRVYGSVVGNNNHQKPGIYVNMNMVELVGYGDVISSGPDGESIFGGQAAAMPAGVSQTPVAPATPMQQPGMGMPQPQQPQQPGMGMPQPQQQPGMGMPQPQQPGMGMPQPQQPQQPQQQPGMGMPQPQQPQQQPGMGMPQPQQPQQPGMGMPQPQQPQQPGMGMPQPQQPAPQSYLNPTT
jgi:hypothetical protein